MFTSLILEVFRFNGALLAAGNRLGRRLGLTSARWQVIGAIALAKQPLTVAEIARAMGVTRQGVQRIADDLEDRGLVERVSHPGHRRARHVRLTKSGTAAFSAISARQVPWANRCSEKVSASQLEAMLEIIRALRRAIEAQPSDPK